MNTQKTMCKTRGMHIVEKKRLYAILGVPLLAFNLSAEASQDDKSFPGALCQPQRNTNPVFRNTRGEMINVGNASQTWICPIVRDDIANDEPEFAAVVASGTNVTCHFHSKHKNGASGVSNFFADSINPVGAGKQEHRFGPGNPNVVNSTENNGYYFFQCNVPRNASITSYRIVENSGED